MGRSNHSLISTGGKFASRPFELAFSILEGKVKWFVVLTTDSGVKNFADVRVGEHMGLRCGTASLAREKLVAPRWVCQISPLQSAQFRLGLPHLRAYHQVYHQAKVGGVNKLHKLAIEVLVQPPTR